MINILLTEKYRPKTFEEIVGYEHNIHKKLDNLPHLLFYGPAGTGKTTTARVIIKTLKSDSLILNSSLDRKIDTVREKVMDFTRSKATGEQKIKIVFLDEAHGLPNLVQESLKNVIEAQSKHVRFIATCNINKIIPELRSRFEEHKFVTPEPKAIFNRLKHIASQENIVCADEAMKLLIKKLYPDIRAMVKHLQKLTVNGTEPITLEKVNQITTLLQVLVKHIKDRDFMSARRAVLDSGIEPSEVFNDLYKWLMKSDLDIGKKTKINEIAMKCNFYSVGAFNKFIPVDGFVFGLIREGI